MKSDMGDRIGKDVDDWIFILSSLFYLNMRPGNIEPFAAGIESRSPRIPKYSSDSAKSWHSPSIEVLEERHK
jgi:hypothetical protein